jgi:hypothetical protein
MATTYYVDLTSSSPTPPYTSWATAATNIQDAVNISVSNDIVLVADGHYSLSAEIVVNEPITIQSVNGYSSTTIDGQWLYRGFHLGATDCIISGFKIINGYSPSNGGGIYCEYIYGGASPLIKDCLIEQCTADSYGGGAYYGTFEHCIVRNNLAANSGGGFGRSIANGCIITHNHAGTYGGGMYAGTANSCTIAYNTSDGQGGGGVGANGTTVNGVYTMKINNSIVWYNADANGKNLINTTSTFSCCPDIADGVMGNIISEPQFVDRTNDIYRLNSGSPCIDTGSNAHAQTTTDFDGNPRIVNGTADMGAYEYQTAESAINLPIRVILEYSPDLNTWTNTGKSVEWLVPVDQSNGFYRARSEL